MKQLFALLALTFLLAGCASPTVPCNWTLTRTYYTRDGGASSSYVIFSTIGVYTNGCGQTKEEILDRCYTGYMDNPGGLPVCQ